MYIFLRVWHAILWFDRINYAVEDPNPGYWYLLHIGYYCRLDSGIYIREDTNDYIRKYYIMKLISANSSSIFNLLNSLFFSRESEKKSLILNRLNSLFFQGRQWEKKRFFATRCHSSLSDFSLNEETILCQAIYL